jgi:hypothetical protein
MTVNYKSIVQRVDSAFKKAGMQVKITRGDVTVGTGYGLFVQSKATMESSPLLQTTISQKVFKLSGAAKAPEVGDTLIANKETFTVKSVETTRPTTTTLAYVLEVS